MRRTLPIPLLVISLLLMFAVSTLNVDAQEPYPEADAQALLDYILETNPYTEWAYWPPEELQGFVNSGAPHGGVVRIFVNDVALSVADAFPGEMPANSIIVKENYMGEDPAEPGEFAALTVMYKVTDFNPGAGDWYWLKSSPDGSTVDAAGMPEGCIGCHGGIAGHKDYILRYGFGGEPALASADQLQMEEGADEEAAMEEEATMEESPAAEPTPPVLPETGDGGNAPPTPFYLMLASLLLLAAAFGLRRTERG